MTPKRNNLPWQVRTIRTEELVFEDYTLIATDLGHWAIYDTKTGELQKQGTAEHPNLGSAKGAVVEECAAHDKSKDPWVKLVTS